MNTTFKYNANAKHSTKDLRGGHNSNNFSLVGLHLDGKGPSVKIQLHQISLRISHFDKTKHVTVGYDEWPLSIALWTKFYNSHGK